MKQTKITQFLVPKTADVGVQTFQPPITSYIERCPYFMTTPSPYHMPNWGVVQNALTGRFYLSTADPLPDMFWVQVCKEKFYEMMDAIKKMPCVDNIGGGVHPFLEEDSMKEDTIVIDEISSIPGWFDPEYTSTRNASPSLDVSLYSANLSYTPFLVDFIIENIP
uniref:RNA-dependent RNA polymerase n=1 Tax=Meloidogyne hapla TaxID=6305 RepID=A0A1I8AXD3_MELHA